MRAGAVRSDDPERKDSRLHGPVDAAEPDLREVVVPICEPVPAVRDAIQHDEPPFIGKHREETPVLPSSTSTIGDAPKLCGTRETCSIGLWNQRPEHPGSRPEPARTVTRREHPARLTVVPDGESLVGHPGGLRKA